MGENTTLEKSLKNSKIDTFQKDAKKSQPSKKIFNISLKKISPLNKTLSFTLPTLNLNPQLKIKNITLQMKKSKKKTLTPPSLMLVQV